jgi:hypothetical protein
MSQDDVSLIVKSLQPGSLLVVLAKLIPLEDAFPPMNDPHPNPVAL